MLQILSALRYNRILDKSETDLRAFGLADGGWFILRFDAGARHMLRVGEVNAARTDSYVQRGEGGSVYLAPYDKVGMLVPLVNCPDTPTTSGATTAATVSAMP